MSNLSTPLTATRVASDLTWRRFEYTMVNYPISDAPVFAVKSGYRRQTVVRLGRSVLFSDKALGFSDETKRSEC